MIGIKKPIVSCIYVAIGIVLSIFPLLAGPYQAKLLGRYLVFGIFAMSFDLLWGYAGIMNFGHAAFFGLGAYSAGLFMKYITIPGVSFLAVSGAILIPMIFAFIIGYFLFYGKVTGVYFAVVTLAFSIFMQAITVTLDFTGGLDGLRGFAPIKIIKYQFTGDWIPYYAIIAVAVLSLLLTFTIVNSSFGRALAALRNDPNRMEALGYNVPFLKLIIFIIACGIAGLAGLLYVPIGHISPEILGLVFSTNALVWVCIGGRGTLIGGFVGALVVSYFQYFLGSKLQNLWFLLIGLFFIIIVLFKSEGIMGFLKRSKY